MKNTKKCPKCDSGNIVSFLGYDTFKKEKNIVMTGSTILSAVGVNRYVCCDCGFTEEWIDKGDLYCVANSKKARREE